MPTNEKAIRRDDDDEWPRPGGSSRAVREYLDALDDGLTPAKRISTTDPAAQWTAAPGGPAFFAYSTNYLVDTDAGIIVDVEATTVNLRHEAQSAKKMIDRVEARFDLKPKRLIGDTAYGVAEMLGWMVDEKGIEPHVPVWEMGERTDGTFSRSDFEYDAAADLYRCPAGKELKHYRRNFKKPRTGVDRYGQMKYRATKHDCSVCRLKAQCCPKDMARKVTRNIHEAARDVARQLRHTEAYRQSRNDKEEGRDAVRTHEANLENGSAATSRTGERERRVLAGRVGAESTTTRPVAGPRTTCSGDRCVRLTGNAKKTKQNQQKQAGRLRAALRPNQNRCRVRSCASGLFNRIDPELTFGPCNVSLFEEGFGYSATEYIDHVGQIYTCCACWPGASTRRQGCSRYAIDGDWVHGHFPDAGYDGSDVQSRLGRNA